MRRPRRASGNRVRRRREGRAPGRRLRVRTRQRQNERSEELNETWHTSAGRRVGAAMSSASLRATSQMTTASGSCSAMPSHSTGLAKRKGTWPVWIRRSRCSCATKAPDAERGQRQRRLPAGASVGGEPEDGQRGEDEDDLRGVREVVVHSSGRRPGDAVGDRVPENDARGRERQRHEPGQRAPHTQ